MTSLSETDWEKLAGKTEGFSGSDLASCVSDAMFEPLRELRDAHFWEITTGRYNNTVREIPKFLVTR